MAGNVLSDIWDGFMGLLGLLIHNIPGVIAVAIIIVAVYYWVNKEKVRDEQKILAKKQWEASKERLPFKTKKTLALCPYPQNIGDLQKNIYQLNYQPIGGIVGVNIFPIINDLKHLIQLSKHPGNEELKKLIEDNQQYIDEDKFWIVFACERRTGGGIPLFPQMKHTLIMAKPSQIIDMNSNDNVIRLKGLGLIPIGEYELVADEFANVNRPQLMMDISELINTEMVLSAWGTMGKVVTSAMTSDAQYRKEIAKDGLIIAQQPKQVEAKT